MGDYHGPVFSNEIDKLRDERDVLHYENRLLRGGAASLLTDNEALSAKADLLRAALLHLRDACRNNPAMQGREYDGLGIEVNDALRASASDGGV